MLLPLPNGLAAANSIASAPVEAKQVCHEMGNQIQHSAAQMDMQQHAKGCCDKDTNCQQQCADCLHCPAGSATLNSSFSDHVQGIEQLYSSLTIFPDTLLLSSHLRPPRV